MSGSFKHQIKYINWTKTLQYNLKQSEFNNLYKSLDPSKRIDIYTKRCLYEEGTWAKKVKGHKCCIYLKKDGEYIRYWTNKFDDNKNYENKHEKTGKAAIQTVSRMFEELNGVTLRKAFGYSPIEVKLMCSPKQFYYTNDRLMNPYRDILSCSMVDFTAHYPSCASGQLPDYNTAVVL